MARKVLEDSFSNHVRSLIRSNVTHDPQYYNLTPYVDGVGTTHVSVLAEDGSAVSATSSINHMSVNPEEMFSLGGILQCSCNKSDGSAQFRLWGFFSENWDHPQQPAGRLLWTSGQH